MLNASHLYFFCKYAISEKNLDFIHQLRFVSHCQLQLLLISIFRDKLVLDDLFIDNSLIEFCNSGIRGAKVNCRYVYFIPSLESTQTRPTQEVRPPRENQRDVFIIESSSQVCVLCLSTRI